MESLQTVLFDLVTSPDIRPLAIVVAASLLALLVRLFFARVVLTFTQHTQTTVDDYIARALRFPVVATILAAGVWWALVATELSGTLRYLASGMLITAVALLWTTAAMRIGHMLLELLSQRVDQVPWIQPKTLPLFDMMLKVVVVGGFAYVACIAWRIPLASWLTSAGIVGIAVGFAAKDTLANLFSGIFIIADAPYQMGDFIILDNGIRGVVIEIGIRSTRLLTRDDVEVTVPNAVIANAKIVNETGGQTQKMRVRVKVSAAYGTDIDRVREALLAATDGVEHLCADPAPRVRFREFGDSGLLFELLAWIVEPIYRGRVLDELNSRVYRNFATSGIEIPYPKQDLYVKELPSSDR
jgi:small-conductance mechanosensitive channel